eukprot:13315084-Alexandrium_andersonii.AAC.1
MSASLVGSEMCIRDRACAMAKYETSEHKPYEHHKHSLRPVSHPAPQSVSYTHLTLPTICSV